MMLAWMFPAALAAGLIPEDAPERVFEVGNVTLTAIVPDGYCVPEGRAAEFAQRVASGDRDHIIYLTANVCGETWPWSDYFAVRTPVAAVPLIITNTQFQKVMEPLLKQAAKRGEGAKRASEQMSEVVQARVEMKGRIAFLGKDDICLYRGGILEIAAGAGWSAYSVAMVDCLTVSGGKVLTVARLGRGKTSKEMEAMLPSVRAFAKTIRPLSPDDKRATVRPPAVVVSP